MEEYKDFLDYKIWFNSYDPNFLEINKRSRASDLWLDYGYVVNKKYKDCVIKPINKYAQFLYPSPELISISNGEVRLRQNTHADIFLLIKEDTGEFYHTDRPWIRQYYQSAFEHEQTADCFLGGFKFYVPWFIDLDIEVSFESPAEVESPFKIYPSRHTYSKVDPRQRHVEPAFVPFNFKRTGKHMIEQEFGVIYNGSPMFDIVFQVSDIIEERVRNFYENYPFLPI